MQKEISDNIGGKCVPAKKDYRKAVHRYCPRLCENVIMLVDSSGAERRFECQNRDCTRDCNIKCTN